MSSARQITYNTRSASELLSCTNYLALHDPSYRVFLIVIVVVGVLGFFALQAARIPVPLFEAITVFLSLIIMPAVANSFVVWGLIKDPRNCTTSLSEVGVTDHTERSNPITFPWSSIVSVNFNKGSVYFFTWRRSVYVPSYAFDSLDDAIDFYNQAQKLWGEARDKKISARISSFDDTLALEADTISRIQEFDAQEEAIWKEMEEKHKKQPEN